jgi:hypothetical protein
MVYRRCVHSTHGKAQGEEVAPAAVREVVDSELVMCLRPRNISVLTTVDSSVEKTACFSKSLYHPSRLARGFLLRWLLICCSLSNSHFLGAHCAYLEIGGK